jgi:tyrosine-protein kinase Etk/Wzc
VEMGDRHLAAAVADAYAEELDKINKEKSISRAKSSRIYIENQLKKTEKNLKQASEALAQFQEKHKAVSLEEQTKTAIEKAGEVKGRILVKEVELGVMLQTMKPDNPSVVRVQKELDELKKQYQQLQYGDDISLEDQQEFYVPFSAVPEVGLKLAELTREVKVQETVWELLNQQYYQAKIQEARDTPTVQVLDKAVPPERRTKPKRKLLVLVAGTLSLFLTIFWAFVLEYFEKLQAREKEFQKVKGMFQEIKEDWGAVKRFGRRRIFRKKGGIR